MEVSHGADVNANRSFNINWKSVRLRHHPNMPLSTLSTDLLLSNAELLKNALIISLCTVPITSTITLVVKTHRPSTVRRRLMKIRPQFIALGDELLRPDWREAPLEGSLLINIRV